jgi:hypothetical protein
MGSAVTATGRIECQHNGVLIIELKLDGESFLVPWICPPERLASFDKATANEALVLVTFAGGRVLDAQPIPRG